MDNPVFRLLILVLLPLLRSPEFFPPEFHGCPPFSDLPSNLVIFLLSCHSSQLAPHLFSPSAWLQRFGRNAKIAETNTASLSDRLSSPDQSGLIRELVSMQAPTILFLICKIMVRLGIIWVEVGTYVSFGARRYFRRSGLRRRICWIILFEKGCLPEGWPCPCSCWPSRSTDWAY